MNKTVAESAVKAAKAQFLVDMKAILSSIFLDILAKYQNVQGFSWCQYTPYFNDGEECYFRVRSDDLTIYLTSGAKWNRYMDDMDDSEEEEYNRLALELEPVCAELEDFLVALGNDDLYMIFGDHTQIHFDRNEMFTVENADHE